MTAMGSNDAKEMLVAAQAECVRLERELAAAQAVIAEVEQYARDREAYGKRGGTVPSARIATDLLGILAGLNAEKESDHAE